jgi:hypothetical protein
MQVPWEGIEGELLVKLELGPLLKESVVGSWVLGESANGKEFSHEADIQGHI